jgi:hypothetical protein
MVFSAKSVLMAAHATMECHAITKQQLHCNRGMVFSMRPMLGHYKQDKLEVAVRGLLGLRCCELLLLEADS